MKETSVTETLSIAGHTAYLEGSQDFLEAGGVELLHGGDLGFALGLVRYLRGADDLQAAEVAAGGPVILLHGEHVRLEA